MGTADAVESVAEPRGTPRWRGVEEIGAGPRRGGGRRARICSAAGRRPVRSAREEASVRRPDGGQSEAKRVDATQVEAGERAAGGCAKRRYILEVK